MLLSFTIYLLTTSALGTQLFGLIHKLEEETYEFNPDDVTPGAIGFLATAAFAVAVILLGLAMYRRVRRFNYRVEIQEEIARELAEKEAEANLAGETGPEGEAKPEAGTKPEAETKPEATDDQES